MECTESRNKPKGLNVKTMRNINQMISSALKCAVEQRLIPTNPTKGCVLPKLERIRFHELRHTYAVFALQSGNDIKTVQKNLCHATAAFTLDIYGHALGEMTQASASRMKKLIQGFTAGQADSGLAVSNA